MSRLIDADALIADCQLAQKQADRHGREFANAFYSGGGEISTEWWCIEDMIDNAPTIEERKTEWIPCSERLPEPRIDVWCNSDMGQMVGYYEENVETWYGRDYLELMVTAWMPLPEPYQGEGDSNDRQM